MATASLPQDPDLDQLRNQARELQRAVRRGEPTAVAPGVSVASGPAACADVEQVRRHLAGRPAGASVPGGPHGWSPLLYLGYY